MNLSENYISASRNSSSSTATTSMSNKYSSLPKFNNHTHSNQSRIVSNNDMSTSSIFPYNRTVSSSSSIMSTPSNNIRKFQRQRQQERQHHEHLPPPSQHQRQTGSSKNEHINNSSRTSKNGRLIKNKLLNLQQSSKQQLINRISDKDPRHSHSNSSQSNAKRVTPPVFGLQKVASSPYDFSVFTTVATNEKQHDEVLFPAIKQSQIRAWESAEKICRGIIFDDDDDDDDEESTDDESENTKNPIISIPGYTEGELKELSKYPNLSSQEEKKLLTEYKRKVLSQREQNLSNNNLISFRRQLQIDQKKEILSKLFNNQNKLNLDYITDNDNNSIDSYTNRNQYNVIDNNLISLDLHSLINNDMEEVNYLLEEDGNFKILQEEVKQNIFHKKIVTDNQQSDENGHGQFDYERFQSLTAKKLDKIYDVHTTRYVGVNADDDEYKEPSFYSDDVSNLELEEELLQFTTGHLRQCIHDSIDEEEMTEK
ncbi:hypothetical protein MGQ_04078 [Candida albicans P76067]|nr:hypothetical protein MGQ_04078 [Candida albicans P76067]